jgi:hypothetical protein
VPAATNPLEQAVQALLTLALALPVNAEINDEILAELGKESNLASRSKAILEGRTGEYGPIPVSPFVEIQDGRGTHEPESQGQGSASIYYLRHDYYVLIYVPGPNSSADPTMWKKYLRSVTWSLWEAVKLDPELGGACEYAKIVDNDFGQLERESRNYWVSRTRISVEGYRLWD